LADTTTNGAAKGRERKSIHSRIYSRQSLAKLKQTQRRSLLYAMEERVGKLDSIGFVSRRLVQLLRYVSD
jgi:hypothetical protein